MASAEDAEHAYDRARFGVLSARDLLEQALFLRQNGERPPGAPRDDPEAETWRDWDRKVERFLREDARKRTLDRLWLAGCELSPEVMRLMDGEALAAHLRDAHPDSLIG